MDRVWEWMWNRYGARYSWVSFAVSFIVLLPVFLVESLVVLAYERSDRYVETIAVTVIATLLLVYVWTLPGSNANGSRLVEQWAAGRGIDPLEAMEATYAWARGVMVRAVVGGSLGIALLMVSIGMIAEATLSRLFQYAIVGVTIGGAIALIGLHSFLEAAMRPARAAISGGSGLGDSLPRSRPTFAEWSAVSVVAAIYAFCIAGALLAAVFDESRDNPVVAVVIASALTFGIAVPITVGAVISPSLQPIRDLAEGTKRVAAGDYGQRLPVVQDDDLGALAASFNRMQAGLAERQRLAGAFGTYVDPVLATRLLEQGDDVFTGERREVTVMFVDIRDFTSFAESNTAEDTVSRLNALFDIVVPAVVDAGGHVNKFLGDGALAVFGAPNELADHAEAALGAAMRIRRRVEERFGSELRIGIGINTGPVIAGTIGGGSKLEFTLIGDTVNVAARVEQLTKNTGDIILLTQQTVDALAARPAGLADRGAHELKGKSAAVRMYAMDHR